MKVSWMVSSWGPIKCLAYGGAALVPITVSTSWRKCLPMNEKLLLFKMFSNNMSVVKVVKAPGYGSI